MTSAIEDTKEETNSYVYSHNHLDETHFSSSFMVFAQLRNEDVLTDITLKAGDDEGLQVTAHKLVLMAASEYFRTMFKACFSEANMNTLCLHGMTESLRDNAYKSVRTIFFSILRTYQGVESEFLRELVDYFYTGEITVTNENVIGLLEAASLLLLPKLVEACGRFLANHIDETNSLRIWALATSRTYCGLEWLAGEAIRFMQLHFEALWR